MTARPARPSDLVAEVAARLDAAGFASPGADAQWLVAHAAGLTPGELFRRWEVDDELVRALEPLVERRLAGEPVQHIMGRAFFRYEEVEVGPGVFIPRPETELVAGAAIDALAARSPGMRVFVELCAGSGAITRSVVRELGGVRAYANERSDEALAYLRRNLDGLGVEIDHGDLDSAFPALDGTVDVVAVNPPYVPEPERVRLPVDVLGRDPDEALFAGEDGLALMPAVASAAARLLKPGGVLVVEHDESHQGQLVGLLGAYGFVDAEGHLDHARRPRYVVARRGA